MSVAAVLIHLTNIKKWLRTLTNYSVICYERGCLDEPTRKKTLKASMKLLCPAGINRLVSSKANRQKPYKIIRAHRRGLLHLDRPHGWGYPSNWDKVARTIRALDHFTCINCGARDVELHVHHIIYVTNFGTHQKQNLVTLCCRLS